MAPDTNFKNQDPKKQYNTPENPKDRHGSYDKGQDFDPTDGYDDHPDDHFTADMVHDEDEFMTEEGKRQRSEHDRQEQEEAEKDEP